MSANVYFLHTAYTERKKLGRIKWNRCIRGRNCFTLSLLQFWTCRHSLRASFVDFMALYLALQSCLNTNPLLKSAVRNASVLFHLPLQTRECSQIITLSDFGILYSERPYPLRCWQITKLFTTIPGFPQLVRGNSSYQETTPAPAAMHWQGST